MKEIGRIRRGPKRALLIVDMINDFSFPDGSVLFEQALAAAGEIVHLRDSLDIPTIYVNDNFHQWHDSFAETISTVRASTPEGRKMVSLFKPGPSDFYVLKPDRSGFYKTPLRLLLETLEVGELIITGIATDMCVLFTANDAHMRGFRVAVPQDCTAAVKDEHRKQALDLLSRTCEAEIAASERLLRLLNDGAFAR